MIHCCIFTRHNITLLFLFTAQIHKLCVVYSLQVDGGSLNVHINLSSLDGASNTANAPSSASATSSAADTSTAQQQGQQAFGASQGGRGLGNTAVEAAQRLAQAKRNFALAENAIARLQVGEMCYFDAYS